MPEDEEDDTNAIFLLNNKNTKDTTAYDTFLTTTDNGGTNIMSEGRQQHHLEDDDGSIEGIFQQNMLVHRCTVSGRPLDPDPKMTKLKRNVSLHGSTRYYMNRLRHEQNNRQNRRRQLLLSSSSNIRRTRSDSGYGNNDVVAVAQRQGDGGCVDLNTEDSSGGLSYIVSSQPPLPQQQRRQLLSIRSSIRSFASVGSGVPSPILRAQSYGDKKSIKIKDDETASTNGEEALPPLPPPQVSFRRESERESVGGAESIYASHRYVHTTSKGFWDDAMNMTEGTIPQSIVVALVIGVVCGLAAWVYYTILEFCFELLWEEIPKILVMRNDMWPEYLYALWIPIVGLSMCILVGLSVVYLGEPGDLPYTIRCVHEKAYIPMDHVMPMFFTSLFSILGGGSLGPEAPLVAMCAAIGGFVSRRIFKQCSRNVVRKHTLMGMSGALAAFFGCPLGGSLFALEVCSRFGIEYFEHMVEAIFCGEVCLVVFRTVSRLPISPIWNLIPQGEEGHIGELHPWSVWVGVTIGLLGAGTAALFAAFHWRLMEIYAYFNLLEDNNRAVYRALAGGVFIVIIGMLLPQTMFWGEYEFETVANMAPSSTLPHIWPTYGLIHFEIDTWWKALIVGIAKLIAISLTVASGYRGGFIFPFFLAGAAFGNVFAAIVPTIPIQMCTLSFAAAINVAITRTSIATTLILVYLAGEQNAITAVLASSVVSLFATSYMPFIKTQIVRSDIDHSLFYKKRRQPSVIQDSMNDINLFDGLVLDAIDFNDDDIDGDLLFKNSVGGNGDGYDDDDSYKGEGLKHMNSTC